MTVERLSIMLAGGTGDLHQKRTGCVNLGVDRRFNLAALRAGQSNTRPVV
ncbi:hypothetical protein J2785_007338 [Burkholderia ambifaria]|nr:hypothetical protein [Burkholderia ambifaria]MDR6504142.1 hypothetical protein [Burkholderia ambifaria]